MAASPPLREIRAARRILIHLNNTNPVLRDDAPERREAEDAGWTIAWDGMEVTL
jgi:pyrroloquinoline quinone biosynthesis protein B